MRSPDWTRWFPRQGYGSRRCLLIADTDGEESSFEGQQRLPFPEVLESGAAGNLPRDPSGAGRIHSQRSTACTRTESAFCEYAPPGIWGLTEHTLFRQQEYPKSPYRPSRSDRPGWRLAGNCLPQFAAAEMQARPPCV